jgi:hypothetical protein
MYLGTFTYQPRTDLLTDLITDLGTCTYLITDLGTCKYLITDLITVLITKPVWYVHIPYNRPSLCGTCTYLKTYLITCLGPRGWSWC